METTIAPITRKDREAIMDIFNHYVEHSFAAYPEDRLPYQAFEVFLQMSAGLPSATIRDRDGKIIGFGMLRVHNPLPSFSRTVEVSCFLHPYHTGKGLGKILLEYLVRGAAEKGIKNILASISSLNTLSIRFHSKNGFTECGRFIQAGRKNGQEFDIIWMQKIL